MQRRYRKKQPQKSLIKRYRINNFIRAPRVVLIDEDDNNLGVFVTTEALKKAQEAELDLVEVSPKSDPPVTRIIDFGHFKYELEKKVKKQKAQQKKTEVKGIRLSFRIKGKDLETRQQQALKFLEARHNVKIDLSLRGRERTHTDKAIELLKKFVEDLGEGISILDPIKRQGSRISIEVIKK